MNERQRKDLHVDSYSERLDIYNEGAFRFTATATINGNDKEYEVSTQTEGEEQLVRDTLVDMLIKANRAEIIDD